MYATCCPAYTIRLEASRFAISKKQRQVIRRIQRYIESGSVLQSNDEGQVEQNKSNGANTSSIKEIKESELLAAKKSVSNQSKKDSISAQIDEFKKPNETEEVKMKTPAHVLECETVTAEFTTERYELYKKYQISVHGDDPCKITPSGFKRFLVESPLFDLSPSSTSSSSLSSVVSCDKELGTTGRKMKIVKPCTTEIHGLGLGMEVKNSSDINSNRKDKIKGVDNSINVEKEGEKVKETVVWKYGSYHQLYRLDRRLVAVGVVDILPSGLSSVYLFYDPDEKLLSLGTYLQLSQLRICTSYIFLSSHFFFIYFILFNFINFIYFFHVIHLIPSILFLQLICVADFVSLIDFSHLNYFKILHHI